MIIELLSIFLINLLILFITMKRKETKRISNIIKQIDKDAILISEKIKTIV